MSRCRVAIELELEGSEDDAFRVIDNLLDAGVVQDAINDAAEDLDLRVQVKSAVTVLMGERRGR